MRPVDPLISNHTLSSISRRTFKEYLQPRKYLENIRKEREKMEKNGKEQKSTEQNRKIQISKLVS